MTELLCLTDFYIPTLLELSEKLSIDVFIQCTWLLLCTFPYGSTQFVLWRLYWKQCMRLHIQKLFRYNSSRVVWWKRVEVQTIRIKTCLYVQFVTDGHIWICLFATYFVITLPQWLLYFHMAVCVWLGTQESCEKLSIGVFIESTWLRSYMFQCRSSLFVVSRLHWKQYMRLHIHNLSLMTPHELFDEKQLMYELLV